MSIFILFALIFLTIVQLVTAITFVLIFAKAFGIDLSSTLSRNIEDNIEEEERLPIEEFKPDFKRPIKVRINGEERDEITPLK